MASHPQTDVPPDALAAALSSLCLLHCLLLPLGLGVAPAIAALLPIDAHGPEWLHWALLALAAPVSVWALWRGMALHGQDRPWQLAALGFALMAGGALAHETGLAEQLLTVLGGLIVAAAHLLNWQARRQRL
ncbi:MAG: MerC domain-containing protein [Sphingomonadaceae bacterium]